jgi:dolichyl-phosphate beta-glucosyltransferase
MISLVIPFYNEVDRIERFLEGVKYCQNRNGLINELILVDDGSTDGTLSYLKQIKEQYEGSFKIKIVHYSINKGKGYAIKLGVLAAQEEWVLCNDADLSYRLEQIDDWYEKKYLDFKQERTVYFGKRILNDEQSKFFLHRIIIGKLFYLFIRLILRITISDTQCGFKLYKTSIAKMVFSNLKEERFAFDLEVIYKLKQDNYSIQHLPVHCYDIKGSKVNLIKDSINMFMALFRIRMNN